MSLAMTIDLTGTPLAITIDFDEYTAGLLQYALDFRLPSNSYWLGVF